MFYCIDTYLQCTVHHFVPYGYLDGLFRLGINIKQCLIGQFCRHYMHKAKDESNYRSAVHCHVKFYANKKNRCQQLP